MQRNRKVGIRNYLLKRFVPVRLRRMLLGYDRRWPLTAINNNPNSPYSLKAFDQLECIFFHIPKTAGLSVSYALFGNRGAGHINVAMAELLFGSRAFKQYYKFAFVRNPWDRFLSAYFYLSAGGMARTTTPWIQEKILVHPSFEEFVRHFSDEDAMENQHFRPQHTFICDRKLQVKVDFIGRYENLEQDFQTVAKTLHVDCSLPQLNRSERSGNWRSYYNSETRQIVAKLYESDVRLFQYEFE